MRAVFSSLVAVAATMCAGCGGEASQGGNGGSAGGGGGTAESGSGGATGGSGGAEAGGTGGAGAGGGGAGGGAAGTDGGAAGDASADVGPKACIDDPSAGSHVYSCDGIKYDVTVPPACEKGPCGLVVDVHGFSMSAKMEDNNTGMRDLGKKYGYVVVQPNAPGTPPTSSWTPGTDDDKVFAFMQLALAAWPIDPKRVHFTGFSQGGMMTFRFVCKHADVLASAAPAAGTGCPFSATDKPSQEIPILFLHGTQDALVSYSNAAIPQRDAVVAGWKMDAGQKVAGDAQFERTRYKSAAGTEFEFLRHDYAASSPIIKGHCYPGSKDLAGGEPGQFFGFACLPPNAFVWGEEAMKFFVAHPKK